jgi:hypothetical protein
VWQNRDVGIARQIGNTSTHDLAKRPAQSGEGLCRLVGRLRGSEGRTEADGAVVDRTKLVADFWVDTCWFLYRASTGRAFAFAVNHPMGMKQDECYAIATRITAASF